MRVHLVGVSGTGMGALAVLFVEAGHEVTRLGRRRSTRRSGRRCRRCGVACLEGYDASHLEPRPDLVVVGNAIRRDNPEAQAAERSGLPRTIDVGARCASTSCEAPAARRRRHARQDDDQRDVRVAPLARGPRARLVHRRHPEGPRRRARPSASDARVGRGRSGARAVRRRGRRVRRRLLAQEAEVPRLRRRRRRTTSRSSRASSTTTSTSTPTSRRTRRRSARFVRSRPREGARRVRRARPARARHRRRGGARRGSPATRSSGDDTGDVTPTWLGAPAQRRARTARSRSTSSSAAMSLRALRAARARARTTCATRSRRSRRASRGSASSVGGRARRTSRRSRA